jgi:hypothetical protein
LRKVGIPGLIKTSDRITAWDNFSLQSPLNFPEHAFSNGWRFLFRFED